MSTPSVNPSEQPGAGNSGRLQRWVISVALVAILVTMFWLVTEQSNLRNRLAREQTAVRIGSGNIATLKKRLSEAEARSGQIESNLNAVQSRLAKEKVRVTRLKKVAAEYAKQLPMQYPDCNVVLVSFDALQAAHVGHLGYFRDVTPTIDEVAEQGFAFSNTYSVASWTIPSTMTWFTGVYPSEHRMVNKFAKYQPPTKQLARLDKMASNLVTLAELFKENGYATAGFTGNAGVSGGFGYEKGFDVYYYPKGTFGGFDGSVPRALDWLKAHKNEKLFLFLHGYDVHGQSVPPGGFDYRFVDKDYDKRYSGDPREQELLREEGLDKGKLSMRKEDVRFWRAVYDEKIQRADARFREFLKTYDKLGLMDKSLFVLTSDHGTEFYEHHRFDHGFTLYDELIHVPLIVRLPKQMAGRLVSDRVSSVDVMPTIIDLANLEVPESVRQQLRGQSLVPVMQGQPAKRDIFAETDYREYTYKRCIVTPDGWKLIYTLEDNSKELYHLPTDPGETKNLVHEEKQRAENLKQTLFAHYRSIGRDLTAERWIKGFNPVYDSQMKK